MNRRTMAIEASGAAAAFAIRARRPGQAEAPGRDRSSLADLLCVAERAERVAVRRRSTDAAPPSSCTGSRIDRATEPVRIRSLRRGGAGAGHGIPQRAHSVQLAARNDAGRGRHQVCGVRPPDRHRCTWGNHASRCSPHTAVRCRRSDRPPCRRPRIRARQGRRLDTCAGEVVPLATGRGGRRVAMLAALVQRWRAALSTCA